MKIFDFPVFAVGYNWTDTSINNGEYLVKRINEIIDEAKKVTGDCQKVILITHSMGGLVARSASMKAESKIIGVIHGVQPATGSAAAYWRVKGGFEGFNFMSRVVSRVLGNSAKTVTPVLGNIPGGLELLPNKDYRDNKGRKEWLIVTEDDKEIVALPKIDPYNEIYRVQATGNELKNQGRRYWGLMDPNLLDEAIPPPKDSDPNVCDSLYENCKVSGWDQYMKQLAKAELFHNTIKKYAHPSIYTFHGISPADKFRSADRILMKTESVWIERESYRTRGFWGQFQNSQGKKRRAVLQSPDGNGDGTVPISSGSFLDNIVQKPPKPMAAIMEHEPAYKEGLVHDFIIKAIVALCAKRYEEKTGKKIGV